MRPALTATLASVALAAAACSGAGSTTATRTPGSDATTTSTSTSTTTTPTTVAFAANLPCGGTGPIPEAVRASAVAGLNLNPAVYRVENVSLAQSDPSWARFDTLPVAGQEGTYKGGSGLTHCTANAWGVTDFGTTEVGCPGGTVAPPPEAVRADLGIDCP